MTKLSPEKKKYSICCIHHACCYIHHADRNILINDTDTICQWPLL